MTDWNNPNERESAMAAKWAEAEERVRVLYKINSALSDKANVYLVDNARLAEQVSVLREALEHAGHVVAYASHEDTVGYRVCCDVRSYEPHSKDCYLKSALEATK